MARQPRGDMWAAVLAHRPVEVRDSVRDRFVANGVTAGQVGAVLADAGDTLCAAATGADEGWADYFGGAVAVALLAAEVSALVAHLNSRASAVRARAVRELLDEYSAVSVAAHLGVARQKVYDIGRGQQDLDTFIDEVPWSNHDH
ncbi:hypothetical protein [Actinokineospora inagensis]|uniref:hypothetical protein n=1 Tax=Actinokineospora inagensis TaxID=103730 RepID=UPI0012F9BD20|nr:hypothetical protein [Actinokineospora inagensis]